MNIEKFGKGGVEQKIDLRNYRFETVVPTAGLLPSKFEIVFGGKIKNQDGSGSCVSQATSYYAEILNFKETGEWVSLSPKFLYSQCHLNPMGSYVKDNMILMKSKGICTEQDLSSYENGNPPTEDFMIRKQDITAQAYDESTMYEAKDYYTWGSPTLDMYKQAIVNNNGCIIISWGNNQCWQNAEIDLPAYRQQMVWQHGILLIGYDDSKKCFKFINSWGTEWGDNGYGYLPYEYVTQGYVTNPFTMIDQSNQIYTLKKKIISLALNAIELLKQKINSYKK